MGHFGANKPSMGESLEHRFLSKVDEAGPIMSGMATCCHEWTGSIDSAGYPKIWLDGNATTAQRAAVIIGGVELDPKECVITICGNRLCVKLDHLAIGPLSDAHALKYRGRSPVGPGDITMMRAMLSEGEVTLDDLAGAYELSLGMLETIASSGNTSMMDRNQLIE